MWRRSCTICQCLPADHVFEEVFFVRKVNANNFNQSLGFKQMYIFYFGLQETERMSISLTTKEMFSTEVPEKKDMDV